MPEAVGTCKSITRDLMIIVDKDGDDIRMAQFFTTTTDEDLQKMKERWLNRQISFYHDHNGAIIRLLDPNEQVWKARTSEGYTYYATITSLTHGKLP